MKKFVVRLIIFGIIILAIDVIVGNVFSYMLTHAKGGDNGRNNFICNEVNSDILIFGSSRAMHHYNPTIISDSLGMSCYNCGQDGNGIILNYGRLLMIKKRYNPKLIIYDVTSNFDLLTGDDNHKYLGWLRAYYDREGIDGLFEMIDPTEKYKMQSQMYRYNTKFLQIVSDFVHPIQKKGLFGFRPVKEQFNPMKISYSSKSLKCSYDSIKLNCFNKFVELSKDSRIVFVVSPYWDGRDSIIMKPIKDMCIANNFGYIDYSNNPKYHHNDLFFYDGFHLNSKGADEFSRDIVNKIKNKL